MSSIDHDLLTSSPHTIHYPPATRKYPAIDNVIFPALYEFRLLSTQTHDVQGRSRNESASRVQHLSAAGQCAIEQCPAGRPAGRGCPPILTTISHTLRKF